MQRGPDGEQAEARVLLSVGSNLGDREGNLRAALARLGQEIAVERVSSLYETDPVGVTDQPAFLNLAALVRTGLPAPDLLALVKRVETDVGRRPTFRWGPRVVDVDIILYGDEVIESADLTIPHPRMAERAFVLAPAAEIAAEMIHPGAGQTVAELLEQAPGRDTVRLYQGANRSSAHGSPSM